MKFRKLILIILGNKMSIQEWQGNHAGNAWPCKTALPFRLTGCFHLSIVRPVQTRLRLLFSLPFPASLGKPSPLYHVPQKEHEDVHGSECGNILFSRGVRRRWGKFSRPTMTRFRGRASRTCAASKSILQVITTEHSHSP
jgi:hypothetical protein